jgi:hypothetical protein
MAPVALLVMGADDAVPIALYVHDVELDFRVRVFSSPRGPSRR